MPCRSEHKSEKAMAETGLLRRSGYLMTDTRQTAKS